MVVLIRNRSSVDINLDQLGGQIESNIDGLIDGIGYNWSFRPSFEDDYLPRMDDENSLILISIYKDISRY